MSDLNGPQNGPAASSLRQAIGASLKRAAKPFSSGGGASYVGALILVGLSLAVWWLLHPWLDGQDPWLLFLPAAGAAAWLGGTGPGWLAAGGGFLVIHWRPFPPEYSGADSGQMVMSGLYLLCSLALAPAVRSWRQSRLREAHFQAAAARRERETTQDRKMWELTFDSVPDLIAILDNQHCIQRVNRAMAQKLGQRPEQCVGLHCYRCVHGTDAPPSFCPHTCSLKDGLEHLAEVYEERLGGFFLVSTTPLRDEEGRTIGSVHVARDISERKRAEAAVQAAGQELARVNQTLEKMVTERTARLQETVVELEHYSYSITHDLRAPLRAMRQFSQILITEHAGELKPEACDYLRRIDTAAHRMDRLVQDVLSYSRISKTEVRLERVDLDLLVPGILEQYPGFQPPQAMVEVCRPLLPVRGNTAFLTQCLSNLLGNAVKFVAKGTQPRIRIRTDALPPHRSGQGRSHALVRLWIEDNGVGIALKDQARIFNIFERVHSTKEYEGTGIGLSIVRKAVERMGGRVGVESALGEGSRFWLELPGAGD